ncbi:MAG: PDZ domain-containing protein [Chlamydiia bacterium]|nr:PDZ domain-containing protein [Chlamydiia bacterium]
MNRIIFGIFFLIFASLGFAQPPEITAKDAKAQIQQIFRSHVSHKHFTPELIQRTLNNYLDELDPTKTYFLASEVSHWADASPALLNQVISDYNRHDFSEFESIQESMILAIERRNRLEAEIVGAKLPSQVNPDEFKELAWVNSEQELRTRLLKIKALQLEAVENFEEETRENFFKRLNKRRLGREHEITSDGPKMRQAQVLVHFLKAASSALDSHTNYFTPAEARQFMIEIDQRLFGIGAQLRDDLNGLTVVRLIEGGPAELTKSLKVGDRIIAVNGEPIVGWEITDAVELIRGKAGTHVNLTLLRPTNETEREKIDVKITRQEIVLKETRYDVSLEPFGDGSIAHIHLYSFYQDPNSSSTSDLKQVITDLKTEHKDKLYGIILDVRSNPGGHLSQAIGVTGLFISKGVVVSIKDNDGNVQHLRNIDSNKVWDGPLIVLTNRGSASASEIVAQTLQDYGRALIVGDDHTFGKGSYQTFSIEPTAHPRVNPKGEYKVTRGMYFTVSGKSPQLHGAQADIVVPGALSQLDVGESFAKFPLEPDNIPAKFNDDLSDISPFQRKKLRLFYEKDLQPRLHAYDPYLDILSKNSSMRISSNKNYQNFLKAISKESGDEIELFGQTDLQKEEALHVMKDLIMLMRLQVHSTRASHPAQAGA